MKNKIHTGIALSALLASLALPIGANAQSLESSALSSYLSASVVAGSVQTLYDSGATIVTAIKPLGASVLVTLKPVSGGIATTIKLSGQGIGASAMSVGETIEVVTGAAGSMLTRSGKVLALIPNVIGESLMHQSTH